jgi:hypothetical protein
MKLADMSEDEQRALAALVAWMLLADGQGTSIEEHTQLQAVAEELGAAELRALLDTVDWESLDRDEARARAREVERKPVQETIYCALLDIAAVATMVPSEREMLDWLSDFWALRPPDGPYR